MSRLGALLGSWRRRALITLVIVGVGLTAAFVRVGGGSAPDLPTVEVTKGEFIDALEIRGEIRPLKSIVLAAPMQSGELQILKLAKNGSMVKPGDVVVQFDSTTLRRTKQEKESELKQADAEIEQTTAQSRITKEQNSTELMRSKYNIERAKAIPSRASIRRRRSSRSPTRSRSSRNWKRRSSPTTWPWKRTCRTSAASVRRRSSICSAPSAGCRTSS